MRIEWTDSKDSFALAAGTYVLAALKAKADANIALPTGNTPLGLYEFLTRQADINQLCKNAFFFNLDEYVGVGAANPYSFATFLLKRFLMPAGIGPERRRLLQGDAADLTLETKAHDAAIAARGGIDLMILGLGANGHIAFNEPGTDWNSGTHIVALTAQTRAANAAYVPPGTFIPTHGITMGIRTIREARNILLIVSGAAKREALQRLLAGRADPSWPVTSLCDHPSLQLIADQALRPA